LQTILDDERAIGVGHIETVDHHDGANCYLDPGAPEPKHFRDMSVLKKELPGVLIVFLIKGAASDEDSDGHSMLRGPH
jgi:hypothetical protein